MLERFRNHIEQKFPFLLNTPFAIAVSGGVDSMVLLDLCCKLNLPCSVFHCNFQLRGDNSREDEQFIHRQGKVLGVSVISTVFDTKPYAQTHKISIQMAARSLRYNWFRQQKEVRGLSWVLTAHHADDNLETFLINLSRASGLEGLTGIPEINDYLIRPLLPFSRDEILRYAKQCAIIWREDSSNAETKYLRNKFRHDIIPLLKEIKPEFLANFKETIGHLDKAQSILKSAVEEKRLKLFTQAGDNIEIAVEGLRKLKPLEAYLYELFKVYGFKNVQDLVQLSGGMSGKQLNSETHRLIRHREVLLLTPNLPKSQPKFFNIESDQKSIYFPVELSLEKTEFTSDITKEEVLLDKEKLKFPLILRKWENGDYFYPFGMQGKKKLSKYFKDEKFSLIEKENQWLLCNGDNQIIWIIGHRADDRFKITEKTTEILKITSLHA